MMYELGTRVHFRKDNDNRLRRGIITDAIFLPAPDVMGQAYDSWLITVTYHNNTRELQSKLFGRCDVEQVMTLKQWGRHIFPQYCRDIVQGKFQEVDMANKLSIAAFRIVLNDEMAPVFADALRQSNTVLSLALQSWTGTDLSVQGLEIVARGIAGCSSLKRIELSRMDRNQNDQSFIDILCRSLVGACPALETLKFNLGCFQPSLAAFRELCNSHVARLEVFRGLVSSSLPRNFLETELSRFTSLRSIKLVDCSSTVTQSFLLGLVEHPSIAKIDVRNCLSDGPLDNQVAIALDRFLTSRAHRSATIDFTLTTETESVVDSNALVEAATRHDVYNTLGIYFRKTINISCARNIESLLKCSKTLRKLRLHPYRCHLGVEVQRRIFEGVRQNQSLHALHIETALSQDLLAALEGNKTLRKLYMWYPIGGFSEAGYDLSGLRHLQAVHTFGLYLDSADIDVHSLIVGLKENTSLEFLRGELIPYQHGEVAFHLRVNQWFNRHKAELVQSPDELSRGLWPHILDKVSTNVNALYHLVRGYPSLADKSCYN